MRIMNTMALIAVVLLATSRRRVRFSWPLPSASSRAPSAPTAAASVGVA